MKYKVSIEGGLMGIPREYQGDLHLDRNEKSLLLNILGRKKTDKNPNLRDGYIYHIELVDDTKNYNATYDDGNMPMEIRKFLDNIKSWK